MFDTIKKIAMWHLEIEEGAGGGASQGLEPRVWFKGLLFAILLWQEVGVGLLIGSSHFRLLRAPPTSSEVEDQML